MIELSRHDLANPLCIIMTCLVGIKISKCLRMPYYLDSWLRPIGGFDALPPFGLSDIFSAIFSFGLSDIFSALRSNQFHFLVVTRLGGKSHSGKCHLREKRTLIYFHNYIQPLKAEAAAAGSSQLRAFKLQPRHL